jgi:hypothetical protein
VREDLSGTTSITQASFFYIMQDALSMQSCRPFDTSGDGKCSNWASVNFLRKYQVAANSTPLVSTGLGC